MINNWQELQDDIGNFTDKTFGESTLESKMTHLQEEIIELLEDPKDEMEWADCFILFLDAARRTGLDMDMLYSAIQKKMDINKKRKWGVPDKGGVVRHVEEV